MPRRLEEAAVFAAPGVFLVLWSSGFVAGKFGMRYAEPLTYLALRMTGVVVVLLAIIIVTRPRWPSPAGWLHSTVAGLLVHGFYQGGVYVSIEYGLSPGLAALVVSLQPVLTSTLANRWLGERVAARQWLGLALGLLGVYLVLRDKTGTGGATLLGWLMAAMALVSITIGTLYQKRFGGAIDWRPALGIQYGACMLLFVLGAYVFETRAVQWEPPFVLVLAYVILVLSIGAVYLFYYLIRRAEATRVVSLFYLTPPTTTLMAWIVFGDRLAPLALLGMAVCVAGVALVNWRPKAMREASVPAK